MEEEVTHRPVDAGRGVVQRDRGTEQEEEGDREEGEGGVVEGSLQFPHPHIVAIETIPSPPDREEEVQGVVDAVAEEPGIDRPSSRAEGNTGDTRSDTGIPIQSPDLVQPLGEDGTGGEGGVEFAGQGWEVQEQVMAPEDATEGNVVPDGEDGEEGGVDPAPADVLVQVMQPLPLLQGQQQAGQGADVDRGRGDGQQVILDPGQLVEQGSDG